MKTVTLPRDPNPYQDLLHAALREQGVQPRYLPMPTRSRSLNILLIPAMLLRSRMGGARILHVHWVFGLTFAGSAASAPLRWLSQLWFAVILFSCRALGVRVIWTAHNVLPHEPVFFDDRVARARLLRSSSHVIVHDRVVVDELSALVGASATLPPVTVVRHGSFGAHYRSTATTGAARYRLGLPAQGRILLFVGRVTVDKGVEDLLAVFCALSDDPAPRHATSPHPAPGDPAPGDPAPGDPAPDPPEAALLVVAGRCADPALAKRLAAGAGRLGPRARLDLRHLPEDELSDYLAAADVVVLPFRRVTTSGSALLAMAFAKPVVIPDLAQLSSVPAAACLRYPAADPDGLRGAIGLACAATADSLQSAGRLGRAWTSTATWPAAATQTARIYRAAVSRREDT